MTAKALMIQGTGSHVGKSILVAALCRIFKQDGFKVAPFKAQNMALNSFVTASGGEMGRAQVVQAQAAGLKPAVEMNPVLLKPVSEVGCQVIVMGKPVGNMDVLEYNNYKKKVFPLIVKAYQKLRDRFEIIVIEGAGSPAEINLRPADIVNMKTARMAGAAVILVGDIDKGGVFAWLYGTVTLLPKREREMIKGVIINKFRGDLSILKPGLKQFSKLSGVPVMGVVPYFNFHIQEEDTLPEERGRGHRETVSLGEKLVRIEVIKLPHLSNFTDFDALERESTVSLRYVRPGESLSQADAYIIPGSKNTLRDLEYLKKSGLALELVKMARQGKMVMGICGGYQMMGKTIIDPGYETKGGIAEGLGLLNTETTFYKRKSTFQVKAKMIKNNLPWFTTEPLEGYEIHMGRTINRDSPQLNRDGPLLRIEKRGEKKVRLTDGTASHHGRIWGTYLHGLFDNPGLRRRLINYLGRVNNLGGNFAPAGLSQEEELDKLAEVVRRNINLKAVYKMLGIIA